MRLENCKNTIQEALIKYSDYSVLEQDLDADTAECMQSWRWTLRRVIAYWRSYFQTMKFVLESKMDTLESDCVLEIVFSNNAVCPGVKDGHFGE